MRGRFHTQESGIDSPNGECSTGVVIEPTAWHWQLELGSHGIIQNFFRLGRHHLRSENYRLLPDRSLEAWREVASA